MVVLKLHLNNILAFYDFNINFVYPRKVNSLIKDEFLEGIPSFRYKKVNVFIGSNATGKTSLCTALWNILIFLSSREKNNIERLISNPMTEGTIEIDFIDTKTNKEYIFYKMKIKSCPIEDNGTKILISYHSVVLKTGDTYESVCKSLERISDCYYDYLDVLRNIEFAFGYNVILPSTEPGFNYVDFIETKSEKEIHDYEKILNAVFKTLDPAILSIKQSKDSNDAYVIHHQNGKKIIVQNGVSLSELPYLSSGTKYGFNIANMIFSIKNHRNGIYIIDEQFSYVNSDIEAATLSTMINLLDSTEQIIFTTHNSNILSIGLPFHSFYFMRKNFIEEKPEITVTCGSSKENRNNVSPKNLYDNDVFATAPVLDLILDLGEENAE